VDPVAQLGFISGSSGSSPTRRRPRCSQTLEAYLDLAVNALATSERLSLHLGLKLARLTGRYRPAG
jgi:hypothetical protein